jgi:hypothetical protein
VQQRHDLIVVMLIASGMTLAAFALSNPWFELDFTGYTDRLEGGIYTGEYRCFPTYFEFHDVGYHTSPGNSPWYGGIAEYNNLMSIMGYLTVSTVMTSMAFLALLIADKRHLAIALGALSSGIALSACLYYALKVGDAVSIYDSGEIPYDIPGSFAGAATDSSGIEWTWGPAPGWGMMVFAGASILAAAVYEVFADLKASTTLEGRKEAKPVAVKTPEDSTRP